MSTRSQKRGNTQQETIVTLSESLSSPVLVKVGILLNKTKWSRVVPEPSRLELRIALRIA